MVVPMATVADALAARLDAAGIRHVFGVPGGGSNLDLIDAIERAGIRFVLTATETGAALAALAQAEVTGRPGVCLTTLGPGAASVVNGVACAGLERAPLIVFTDSHPIAAAACEHQRLDERALFAPITKWTAALQAESAPEVLDEALHRATTPPGGPVHLECPGDVLGVEDGAGPSTTLRAGPSTPLWAGPSTALRARRESSFGDGLLQLLLRARKPVIVAGLGARTPDAAAAVRALCEARGIPAFVTYKGKGIVPDAHPWFAGIFTNGAIERPLVDAADLVIGLGLDPVELIPRRWSVAAPVVSCAPWRMDDRHVPFAAQHVGDVAEAAARIGTVMPRSAWTDAEVCGGREAQRTRVAIPVPGFAAQDVVAVAARRLAPAARVTVDAGAHMFPATMGWPVNEPGGLLISNGLSTMGFAVPAAIGASLADPGRRVVALTGDGGLLMCLAELGTAVRERLPIVVLVFADQALSLIDIKQQHRRLAPAGVRLGDVSWRSIAEGFGLPAFVAADEAGLERALDAALAVEGPSVVEARIDAANYGQMLGAIRGSS